MKLSFIIRCIACLVPTLVFTLNPVSLIDTQPIAYRSDTILMLVPECPLQVGSLQIVPISGPPSYCQWTDEEHLEAYRVIQKLDQLWFTKGITDYCIYGRESIEAGQSFPFKWEMIPCPKSSCADSLCLRFITTVIHIAYGAKPLPAVERDQMARDINEELQYIFCEEGIKKIPDQHEGKDIFCQPSRFQHQLIYEGKTISILYDYAPAAEIHLLFVTKKHRERFFDLTAEEYLEAIHLSKNVIKFYQERGFQIANIHVKNGKESGQSQPHWHLQVAISTTRQDELMAALEIIKDACLKCHTPLPKDVLENRVRSTKEFFEEFNVLEIPLNPQFLVGQSIP